MDWARRRSAVDAENVPREITALGVAAILAFAVETAAFSGLDPDLIFMWEVVIGFLTSLPFAIGIAYGGYWLARSDVEPVRYERVGMWGLGGTVVCLVLNALILFGFPPDTLWNAVGWLRGAATWGGAIGLLVGIVEARAIQNAIEVERAAMQTAYLEQQREGLDYLNGLLRHEVLNTAQVITGYATVLLENGAVEGEQRSKLGAIRRQSQDMTRAVEDVRLLAETMRDEADLRPVDLSAVVRAELQDLRDAYDVEIDLNVDENLTVRADGFLPRLIGNLLTNAVVHNDADRPHVEVTVERDDGAAVVTVADDGPGVPPEVRDGLFEREDLTHADQGLGLYLVARLVDRYDGRVELSETGSAGSTFAVEVPLADGNEGDGSAATSDVTPAENPGTSVEGRGRTTKPATRRASDGFDGTPGKTG